MGDNDKRSLRDEDRALWETFTRPIKPLRKRAVATAASKAAAPEPDKSDKPEKLEKRKTPAKAAAPAGHESPKPPASPPLMPLDRRTKARVARGHTAIDRRIDLHGLTQAQAHAALLHFIRQSAAQEARTVLVITGKSGVLRRQVPYWLALPDFRALLIGFEQAAIRHGGEGALYLRLRRSRD
jgi:DNA-nicking Smr family endonuclease